MSTRLLPGLIQDAFISLKAKEFSLRRKYDGSCWQVWRMSPTGYVWNADFADKRDAVDYAAMQLGQHDNRPR